MSRRLRNRTNADDIITTVKAVTIGSALVNVSPRHERISNGRIKITSDAMTKSMIIPQNRSIRADVVMMLIGLFVSFVHMPMRTISPPITPGKKIL